MKTLIFALLLISTSAHAFNWSRCNNASPVTGGSGIIEMMSTTVSNVGVSSSQFLSSWGECSMVGEVEKVRKTFIAQNLNYLQQDMAKGNGEYLAAYARLHDCNQKGMALFGKSMKQKYFEIKKLDEFQDFDSIFRIMERPFIDLKGLCPLT